MGAAHRGVVDREYSDSPDEDGFVEHPDGRSRRANGKLHEDDLDGFPEEWEDIPCKNGRNHKEDDWHNEDDLDGSPDEREDPRHNHGGNHAENGWHDEDELDGSPKEPDEPVRNGASRFTKTETIDNSDDEISDVPTIDEEKAAAIHTYFRTQKYFNGHGDFPEGYEEACKLFTKQDMNVLNLLGDWSDHAREDFSLLDTFQIAQHFYASIDMDATMNTHWRELCNMLLAFLAFAVAVYAMCYLAIYSMKNAYVDADNILRNWDGSQVQTICGAHQHR